MATQTVADVMTDRVVALAADAPVREAAEAMRDNDIGDVIVLDEGKVRGIVTDRDLVVRVVAERLDPTDAHLADVCSANVIAARPDTTVDDAVRAMRERAVRRLPVVDSEGRPVGVVSLGDLARAQAPQSALADISNAPPNT